MKKYLAALIALSSLFLVPHTSEAEAANGEAVYAKYCSGCHGAGGAGTDKGSPLVHKIYRPGHHADITFHLAVRRGVRAHHWRFGDMPPVDGVTEEEVNGIIEYIRGLQREVGIH